MATKQQVPTHPMPFTRIELVVLSVRDGQLQALLVRREQAPHKGLWALPGGVVRIDLDADLAAAAFRVGQERLGVSLPNLQQVMAVGGTKRDPRSPWTLSVVYASLVQPGLELSPGKRVEALQWRPVGEPGQSRLAFDHGAILHQAVADLRARVAAMQFPPGWLPELFTIPELQRLSEMLLGRTLNKVSFRRRLDSERLLVAVEGQFRRERAFRPAQLYRFAKAGVPASPHGERS